MRAGGPAGREGQARESGGGCLDMEGHIGCAGPQHARLRCIRACCPRQLPKEVKLQAIVSAVHLKLATGCCISGKSCTTRQLTDWKRVDFKTLQTELVHKLQTPSLQGSSVS